MVELGESTDVDAGGPVALARAATDSDEARRSGFSYIEVLVSIVLIGTIVVATLVSLRATITASQVADDRSRLMLWAQEGADAVQRVTPFVDCSAGVAGVKSAYKTALDAVPAPPDYSAGTLTLDDPEFLSIHPTTFVERWDTVCDPDRHAHLLTLRAISPDGSQTSTLEVIVNG